MIEQIKYNNGYSLSYAEYGDRRGNPILVQHGLIASISDYHLFDSLITAGKRLICIARPGYGESSPYRMRNIAEWGDIISVLVDELELAQCDVLGMSSGAPYSYSIGYRLPDRVQNIYIFSGTPALYDERVLELWPYPVTKNASIEEMADVAKGLFFSKLTKEDRLRNDIRDSMANECFGIVQDFQIRCLDWGFKLTEVRASVYMEHSREDCNVPFATAELTAMMMPKCRLETRDGEHFSNERLDNFIQNTMLRH